MMVSPFALFPTYLLPPLHLCRRWRRTAVSSTDGKGGQKQAAANEKGCNQHVSRLCCANCASDICFASQIISKGFTGRHGRAYLVSPMTPTSYSPSSSGPANLPNTRMDAPSQRQLVTGAHTVSDVRCVVCASMLGWKYDAAEDESQRYKVGKYILETKMICASNDWEYEGNDCRSTNLIRESHETETAFDSQDEDECEDLFAGIWTPALARRRRQNRAFRREESARPINP